MKATEQYFPMVLSLCCKTLNVVLTFESVDEILTCEHSKSERGHNTGILINNFSPFSVRCRPSTFNDHITVVRKKVQNEIKRIPLLLRVFHPIVDAIITC